MIHIVRGFDYPGDPYPDDPDYECNECGYVWDDPTWQTNPDWIKCPACGGTDVHGGGYYG